MTVDTKKLRSLAEKATPGSADESILRGAIDGATVIALLDEIERLSALAGYEKQRSNDTRANLDIMTAARDEACELAEANANAANLHTHHMDRLRIAELRKVGTP